MKDCIRSITLGCAAALVIYGTVHGKPEVSLLASVVCLVCLWFNRKGS